MIVALTSTITFRLLTGSAACEMTVGFPDSSMQRHRLIQLRPRQVLRFVRGIELREILDGQRHHESVLFDLDPRPRVHVQNHACPAFGWRDDRAARPNAPALTVPDDHAHRFLCSIRGGGLIRNGQLQADVRAPEAWAPLLSAPPPSAPRLASPVAQAAGDDDNRARPAAIINRFIIGPLLEKCFRRRVRQGFNGDRRDAQLANRDVARRQTGLVDRGDGEWRHRGSKVRAACRRPLSACSIDVAWTMPGAAARRIGAADGLVACAAAGRSVDAFGTAAIEGAVTALGCVVAAAARDVVAARGQHDRNQDSGDPPGKRGKPANPETPYPCVQRFDRAHDDEIPAAARHS